LIYLKAPYWGGGVVDGERCMASWFLVCDSDRRGVISGAAWPSNVSRRVFLVETCITRSARERCCPSQLAHQPQTAIFMWPAMEWLVLGYRLAGPRADYSISNFQWRGSTGRARARHMCSPWHYFFVAGLQRRARHPNHTRTRHRANLALTLPFPRIARPQILPALRAPS